MDLELFEGVQVEQEELAKHQSEEGLFREKKAEIGRLKKQAEKLELVRDAEEKVKRTDLFSVIYESKERVGTVDCSRYHPALEKNYDIKELFMTGMDTDFLQEEAKK